MQLEINNLTNEIINEEDLKNVCKIALKKLKVKKALFNITIVDDKRIHEINKTYRDVDRPTDVISFAFEDNLDIAYSDFRFLGEIYISIDTCKRQAVEYGHDFKREICFLTVHGLLHLLGYDHIEEEDRKVMRALEESVLDEYDVKR